MREELAAPLTETLSDDQRRRGQSALISVGATLSAGGVFLSSNVMTLFLLGIGATPFHIGLMTTLERASQSGQVVGLRVLRKASKAKWLSLGKLLAGLPLFVLVALACAGFSGSAAVAIRLTAFGGIAGRLLCSCR